MTFQTTSSEIYPTKNSVRPVRYWLPVIWRSASRPSNLALATFERSRKDRRYSKVTPGMILRSIFLRKLLSLRPYSEASTSEVRLDGDCVPFWTSKSWDFSRSDMISEQGEGQREEGRIRNATNNMRDGEHGRKCRKKASCCYRSRSVTREIVRDHIITALTVNAAIRRFCSQPKPPWGNSFFAWPLHDIWLMRAGSKACEWSMCSLVVHFVIEVSMR